MSSADSACYVAKKQGGLHVPCVFRARGSERQAQRRDHWLQKLQGALRDNKFELYFQPIVHAQLGGVRGPAIEVFVEWRARMANPAPAGRIHPGRRALPADALCRSVVVQAVLSALGRGGLRVPVGRALRSTSPGRRWGFRIPGIRGRVLSIIPARIRATFASKSRKSVVGEFDHARRFIAVLHGMGCDFALDDFGSGLSFVLDPEDPAIDYSRSTARSSAISPRTP